MNCTRAFSFASNGVRRARESTIVIGTAAPTGPSAPTANELASNKWILVAISSFVSRNSQSVPFMAAIGRGARRILLGALRRANQ